MSFMKAMHNTHSNGAIIAVPESYEKMPYGCESLELAMYLMDAMIEVPFYVAKDYLIGKKR